MTQDEFQREFEAYKNFGGEQGFFKKILVIYLNRIRQFYREPNQWFILFFPLLYVMIQLFIIYAVLVACIPVDHDDP